MIDISNIRKELIDLAIETKHGHLAPALSCIDIMAILYSEILDKDDKFILSKGHAVLALYLMLRKCGYNPNMFCGHPEMDLENGIVCSTGSLGHGFPIGLGMAFAKKFKQEDGRIFVLMSDGECQEGTTWESLLLASKHKLDNLTIIIDRNKLQALDFVDNVLPLGNLKEKIECFGWNCIEINGHDMGEIRTSFNQKFNNDKPIAIIANTIKGKGVKMAENVPDWHYKLPIGELINKIYGEL